MQVILEAIKFNHDPKSAAADAFNIRRNETEVVHVPEWRRGVSVKPEDSPAAYARDALQGRTPTIKAKFSFKDFDTSIQKIKIRAVDGRLTPKPYTNQSSKVLIDLLKPVLQEALSDNVLGSVMERDVQLMGEEFDFNLVDAKIASAGVSASDIIWRWQFRTESTDWTDFATTTHRIFTVLAMPTARWEPESDEKLNTQQPWVEVLDYACRWAAATTHVDEAATLVTQTVNGLGPTLLEYDDVNSGSPGYAVDSSLSFDCTDFLKRLRDQPNKQGRGVNCDDCAAVVVSFANILGCDLNESKMGLSTFDLKRHLQIGLRGVFEGAFTHHTVAWKRTGGDDDELFDACLQLDHNLNLNGNSGVKPQWFVPTNLLFGRLDQHEYRFRLTVTPAKCQPHMAPRRRRIGLPRLIIDADSLEAFLQRSKQNPFVSQHILKKDNLLTWRLADTRFLETDDSSFMNQSFWTQLVGSDAAMGIDAYQYEAINAAREAMSRILSSFQLDRMVEKENPGFGDLVFAVPTNYAIVFRRGRFVFRLRNVGRRPVPCDDFARFLDKLVNDAAEPQP